MTREALEAIWREERMWMNSPGHIAESRNAIDRRKHHDTLLRSRMEVVDGNLVREMQNADGRFCGYVQIPLKVWARNLRAS